MVSNFTWWCGLAKGLFPAGAISRSDEEKARYKGLDPAGVAGFCFAMMGLIVLTRAIEQLMERLF